jgi:hypothetical protein
VESQGRGLQSYGSMGARAGVQQLRQTVRLQLADTLVGPHSWRYPVGSLQGRRRRRWTGRLEASAGAMIDDLLWWTAALKAARASVS